MASTEERVRQVIAKQLNIDISDVKDEERFIEVLSNLSYSDIKAEVTVL